MRRAIAAAVVCAVSAGCLLTTSLDGFTGGAEPTDAADVRAPIEAASDAGTPQSDATYDARVEKLVLVRASNVMSIAGYDPLADGTTLRKSDLPAFTVVAVTSPVEVGSVVFGLDGNPSFNVEGFTPYTLTGDDNSTATPWMPSVGAHTIVAVPYAGDAGVGAAGTGLVVHVVVQP
ncbi:MAG TPA: hypothetical protein VIF62_31920 [Labilithrix sp.]|jgi:hypothetical protein